MSIVVVYHKDCMDGFGAALVAWKKFGGEAELYSRVAEAMSPEVAQKPTCSQASVSGAAIYAFSDIRIRAVFLDAPFLTGGG